MRELLFISSTNAPRVNYVTSQVAFALSTISQAQQVPLLRADYAPTSSRVGELRGLFFSGHCPEKMTEQF